MTVLSLLFTDARTQVLSNTSNFTVPGFEVYDDYIIQSSPMKHSLVGFSNWQYTIDGWSFTILYDSISDDIMDLNGLPIYLDQNRILNKYMVYIKTDKGNIGAFILSDTQDISIQNNTYKFTCVPMMGVIARYAQANIDVPHKINLTPQLMQQLEVTADDVPSIADAYATIVADIFSTNNTYASLDALYNNETDKIDTWYAKGNTSYVASRKHLKLTYDQDINMSNTNYTVQLYTQNDKFNTWRSTIHNHINFNPEHNPQYYSSSNRYGRKILWDTWYGSNEQVLGNYQYVQKYGISFLQDVDGMQWQQLKNILYNMGFFGQTYPLTITSAVQPDTLPSSSIHIIGRWQYPPQWVIDNGNPYHYKNLVYYDKPVSLYVQYTAFGISWQHNFPYRFKSCNRTLKLKLNINNPTIFDQIDDTGFVYVNQSGIVNQDMVNTNAYRYKFIPEQVIQYPYAYASDDFYKGNDTIDLYNTWTSNGFTITIITNTMNVLMNMPVVSISNTLQINTQLSLIDILKQLTLFRHSSIMPYQNGSLYYYYGSMCAKKYITNNLHLIENYYQLDSNQIQQYKYIYHLNETRDSVYIYNVFVTKPLYNRALLSYINEMNKNYVRKIRIRVIGLDHPIDLFENRFVRFNNINWQIISLAYDYNSTIIQCIGK